MHADPVISTSNNPTLIENKELNSLVIQEYISKVFSEEKKFSKFFNKRKKNIYLFGAMTLIGFVLPMISMDLFQILFGLLIFGISGLLVSGLILYVEYSVQSKMDLNSKNLMNIVTKYHEIKKINEIYGNEEKIKANIDKILLFVNIYKDSEYSSEDIQKIKEDIEVLRLNPSISSLEYIKAERELERICFKIWEQHKKILSDIHKNSPIEEVPIKVMTKEELVSNINEKKEEFLKNFLIKQ